MKMRNTSHRRVSYTVATMYLFFCAHAIMEGLHLVVYTGLRLHILLGYPGRS